VFKKDLEEYKYDKQIEVVNFAVESCIKQCKDAKKAMETPTSTAKAKKEIQNISSDN
jgi:hypothetical protein